MLTATLASLAAEGQGCRSRDTHPLGSAAGSGGNGTETGGWRARASKVSGTYPNKFIIPRITPRYLLCPGVQCDSKVEQPKDLVLYACFLLNKPKYWEGQVTQWMFPIITMFSLNPVNNQLIPVIQILMGLEPLLHLISYVFMFLKASLCFLI